jgi:hypothetical protein
VKQLSYNFLVMNKVNGGDRVAGVELFVAYEVEDGITRLRAYVRSAPLLCSQRT